VVKLDHQVVPERTTLIPLQPIGVGTTHVESLSSYFQRLADWHAVSPKLLAREFVLPRLGFNNRVGEVQADRYWRSSFFNGIGEVPHRWCRILSDLTGVAGLHRLTLVPLQGLTNLYGSASDTRRWCPRCLDESERAGLPYGQLLWEIGCVKACPKHEMLLVSEHGCNEEEAIRPLRLKPLPHLCRSCGGSLSLPPTQSLERAEEFDVDLAKTIGELLASHLFAEGPRESGRTICDFLFEAITKCDGGCGMGAVRRLGANKADVSGWVHKKHLPSLPQAATIARAYGVPLADALLGKGTEHLRTMPWVQLNGKPTFKTNRLGFMSSGNPEANLRRLLASSTPPSEALAASWLGTRADLLRHQYPELCHALAERHAEWVTQEANRKRDERLILVKAIVEQMACEGEIPTISKLEKRLTGVPKSFLFKERTACKRICEAARTDVGI